MRSFLAAILLAPLAVLAQNASVTVSTSFLVTQIITVSNGNRVFTTISSAIPITITAAAATTSATGTAGNSTASGNSTAAASSSGNATASSTSSTSSSPLPTAVASNINGGGNGGNGGAPTPGAAGANGVYGPDDNYNIDGAVQAAAAMAMTGLAAGGALLLLL